MNTHFIELDPYQLVLLTDLMDAADKAGQIPAGKAMAWASLRQQLAQPRDTKELVESIRAQAAQEFIKAAQAGGAPLPPPLAKPEAQA
jgi:hypothetical protein